MFHIEWWLMKYEQLYKDIYFTDIGRSVIVLNSSETMRYPIHGEPTEKEKVLFLYENLNKISELHKNEMFFRQEITHYKKVLTSNEKLNRWLETNKSIA